MREIKFRVWNKIMKKMEMVKEIRFNRNNGMTIFKKKSGGHINILFELMQYTGIKDKNGKEIYEGDIIEIINPFEKVIGIIQYSENYSSYGYKIVKIIELSKDLCPLYAPKIDDFVVRPFRNGFECEVIGNIYENPELLEETEK